MSRRTSVGVSTSAKDSFFRSKSREYYFDRGGFHNETGGFRPLRRPFATTSKRCRFAMDRSPQRTVRSPGHSSFVDPGCRRLHFGSGKAYPFRHFGTSSARPVVLLLDSATRPFHACHTCVCCFPQFETTSLARRHSSCAGASVDPTRRREGSLAICPIETKLGTQRKKGAASDTLARPKVRLDKDEELHPF